MVTRMSAYLDELCKRFLTILRRRRARATRWSKVLGYFAAVEVGACDLHINVQCPRAEVPHTVFHEPLGSRGQVRGNAAIARLVPRRRDLARVLSVPLE